MNLFDSERFFEHVFFESFGEEKTIVSSRLIAAGSLNQGVFLETSEACFFLKTNFSHYQDIFHHEYRALNRLKGLTELKIPEVYHVGNYQGQNFLLMEWVEAARKQEGFWRDLGEGLAQLHMHTQSTFGFESDNYIASIPQINIPKHAWVDFYINNRLEVLAGKAYYEGLLSLAFYKEFQRLYPLLENLIPVERPSLIHGDLWSGNVMIGNAGQPCLIDPAIYFGHREMDLAFSRLFGGFDPSFYHVYDEVFPLEPGFEQRMDIHNLYPLLVHVLLFGESYVAGIAKTLRKYLS
jgi:protein-ribulosamine 3-kinase